VVLLHGLLGRAHEIRADHRNLHRLAKLPHRSVLQGLTGWLMASPSRPDLQTDWNRDEDDACVPSW
jgi:hypothetical protein